MASEDRETAALEATVTKITARNPDKLYVVDDRRRARFEAELERQIGRHAGDDQTEDADSLLDTEVFDNDEAELQDAQTRGPAAATAASTSAANFAVKFSRNIAASSSALRS